MGETCYVLPMTVDTEVSQKWLAIQILEYNTMLRPLENFSEGKTLYWRWFQHTEVTRVAYTMVSTPSMRVTNVTKMSQGHWQTTTIYCNSSCKPRQQKVCKVQTVTVSHTVLRKYCTTRLCVYWDTTAQGLQQYIYMCESAQYIRYNSPLKSFLLTI